jgi:polyhydroxybutyrate depolymerase
MKIRKILISAVLVVIGLPVALVLIVAAWIHVLDRSDGTIVSSGRERQYLLHVPASYDRTKPAPLVISMHGAVLWPAAQMEISQWNRLADEHGFIVVYPSGFGTPRHWGEADVRFISDLIDKLEATYNIDAARIYANGFSNGGEMAFDLSCNLSDRIAAIGTVAPALLDPWSRCTNARPLPIITFHGTADPLAPYNGGMSPASPPEFIAGKTIPFDSVATWLANWARRNRCASRPAESVVAADVTRLEYPNCAGDAAVVAYIILDGGHAWPGGKPMPMMEWFVGRTSTSIDASSLMWAFFRERRLSPRP